MLCYEFAVTHDRQLLQKIRNSSNISHCRTAALPHYIFATDCDWSEKAFMDLYIYVTISCSLFNLHVDELAPLIS